MRGAMWRLLRPWLVPFALLALWQLASTLGGHYSYAFVPLQKLTATFIELSSSGELVRHAYASVEVVLRGLLTGGSIGLAVGGLMAYSATAAKLIGPLFNAWRPVPTLGFIPLIALWFGSGDLAKMVLVCLAAAEPMVLNTYEGLRHADRRLIESGQVLTFTRWQLFRYIQAPAAMPSIITGLQHALGFAWIATIGAELLFTIGPGLGGIMERAQNSARLDTVIVCVACIGAVGLAINSLVTHLGNRVLQWRDHA